MNVRNQRSSEEVILGKRGRLLGKAGFLICEAGKTALTEEGVKRIRQYLAHSRCSIMELRLRAASEPAVQAAPEPAPPTARTTRRSCSSRAFAFTTMRPGPRYTEEDI